MDAERIQEIKDQELQGGPEPTPEDYEAAIIAFRDLLSRATDAAVDHVKRNWEVSMDLGFLPKAIDIDRDRPAVFQALEEMFWHGIREAHEHAGGKDLRYVPQAKGKPISPLVADLFQQQVAESVFRQQAPRQPVNPQTLEFIDRITALCNEYRP